MPASAQPWFSQVATGIPAFAEGRWWSPLTSMFFVDQPWVYLTLTPLLLGSLVWAEWRFGTLRTIALFVTGHLVGVFGGALVVWLLLGFFGAAYGPGRATKLSVRPEAVHLGTPPAGPEFLRLDGEIHGTVYLGETAQHQMDAAGADGARTTLTVFELNPEILARDEARPATAWIHARDVVALPQ